MAENSEKTAKKPRGKPFQKGQTGNPGGRPPKTEEQRTLEELCRAKSARAFEVLSNIMESGENERNKITAALAIIERGHGKAVQPTTLSGPNGGAVEITGININLVKPSGT